MPQTKRYLRRNGSDDIILPECTYKSRITTRPVLSAEGDQGSPLFVFGGARMPHQEIEIDGTHQVDTLNAYFPPHCTVAMNKEHGDIDSVNFYNWAKLVVSYVSDLTQGDVNLRCIPSAHDASSTGAISGCKHNRVRLTCTYNRKNHNRVRQLHRRNRRNAVPNTCTRRREHLNGLQFLFCVSSRIQESSHVR